MDLSKKHFVVEPDWSGESCFIVACGPSLTDQDVQKVADAGIKTIVISNAWAKHPNADLMYSCDKKWWDYHYKDVKFAGLKCSMQPTIYDDVLYIENAGTKGLSLRPGFINTGGNSSYQALNIAVQLGVKRVCFLGLDMCAQGNQTHFFGKYPADSKLERTETYQGWINHFNLAAPELEDLGIEVINCSPISALQCFKKMNVDEAIKRCQL